MASIRKALPEDLASIAEYYGSKGDTPWDPFTSEDRLRRMIELKDLVVAEADGLLVGFVYFFVGDHPWFEPEVGRYGHILEVHVRKDYQCMGIATEMLEYALSDLKKRRVEVAYIDTGSNNAQALHLYENLGFREFGRTLHLKRSFT